MNGSPRTTRIRPNMGRHTRGQADRQPVPKGRTETVKSIWRTWTIPLLALLISPLGCVQHRHRLIHGDPLTQGQVPHCVSPALLPDSDFHGHRPTRWRTWPADKETWYAAYWGDDVQISLLPPTEPTPATATEPMPAAQPGPEMKAPSSLESEPEPSELEPIHPTGQPSAAEPPQPQDLLLSPAAN